MLLLKGKYTDLQDNGDRLSDTLRRMFTVSSYQSLKLPSPGD